MDERLRVTQDGPIYRLTIDHPSAGNAFDAAMMEALPPLLDRISSAGDCHVLVVTGSGPDFCLGRTGGGHAAERPPARAVRAEVATVVRACDALREFPLPTVAAVRGRALGFGAGLAARCDFVLAARDARLGFPEIHSGIPPAIVISFVGKAISRRRAFEIVVTGRELSADEAASMDLVNRVVASEALDAATETLAQEIAAKDPVALQTIKRSFQAVSELGWQQAGRYAADAIAAALGR